MSQRQADAFLHGNDGVLFAEPLVLSPSAVQSLAAGDAVAVTSPRALVQGSGGAVTITATPSITAGQDGQVLLIVGESDTNTLKLQSEANLTGSTLALAKGIDITLGLYDVLELFYDSGAGRWIERNRSNNSSA